MTTVSHSSPPASEPSDGASDARAAFSTYHRHRRRGELARRFPVAVCTAIALFGLTVWTLNASHAAEAAQKIDPVATASVDPVPIAIPVAASQSPQLPGPASGTAVRGTPEAPMGQTVAPPDAPVTQAADEPGSTPHAEAPEQIVAPSTYDIAVTASGHQAEIDACEWVRIDVGAVAPIVGAHNNCGGHIVLEMRVGDTVLVRGEGLDGLYQVGEERAAQAGQIAATATAGMNADLIAQTCLWEGNGHLRLLSLVRVKGAEPLS